MTGSGKFTELQGTAEATPFSRSELDSLLELAEGGIRELLGVQRSVLEPLGYPSGRMTGV
jgi:ribonuclease PH